MQQNNTIAERPFWPHRLPSWVKWTILFIGVSCKNIEEKNRIPGWTEEQQLHLRKYILSLPPTGTEIGIYRLDSILAVAEKDSVAFHRTVNYLQEPLAGPNSVYRNTMLNIELQKAKLRSIWFSDSLKKEIKNEINLLLQNCIGERANDFIFINTEGSRRKLYDLKARYTLLFFYNPKCDACRDMKTMLGSSGIINKKLALGELKVLSVYTDRDEQIWLNHLSELPAYWVNGRDENEYLFRNRIYDLRAIPTVYLLDRNKKVILKDCMAIAEIERKLTE